MYIDAPEPRTEMAVTLPNTLGFASLLPFVPLQQRLFSLVPDDPLVPVVVSC